MLLASSLLSTSAAASALGLGAGPKGAVSVDVDLTFLWSVLVFLVLIAVLRPLLFEPMLRLFEERERRIEGTKLEARRLDDAAGEALSRYEGEMKKARAAGNLERDAHRADGQKAENEILGKVREATTETVNAGRRDLQQEAAGVRVALQAEARALAASVASRVLGREVRG
jgi:F-type H+-transporting ATPase subunit b